VLRTKRAIALRDGPVLLVGHSYGGVVITEAGNDPKVVGLVYVAALRAAKRLNSQHEGTEPNNESSLSIYLYRIGTHKSAAVYRCALVQVAE
jgi:hypothetical protein